MINRIQLIKIKANKLAKYSSRPVTTLLRISVRMDRTHAVITASRMLLMVTRLGKRMVYLMARSLSPTTSDKWSIDTSDWYPSRLLLISRSRQLLGVPLSWNAFQTTRDGCRATPQSKSVSAKQANRILVLLCSRDCLFTACYDHQHLQSCRTKACDAVDDYDQGITHFRQKC